jgi:hypothetical protein
MRRSWESGHVINNEQDLAVELEVPLSGSQRMYASSFGMGGLEREKQFPQKNLYLS